MIGRGVEWQYPIPANTVTLGKLLQQGYVTGAFGKWGLGGSDSDGRPLKQGIHRFFGYNCQGVAHNFPGYGGQVALRIGDWKGVVQNLMPQGNRPAQPWKIELYNLMEDIAESTDLAASHPEIVAKKNRLMREQHTPSAEFPFKALDDR